MALFDLPLEQLKTYLPTRHEPENFAEFWQTTLNETRDYDLNAEFIPVDAGLKTLDVFDVTFSGFAGQRIKGWLLLPRGETGLPCVVEYIGYGGGRGFPSDWLLFASAGYAHLVMDTRGQGSAWRQGDTPDEGAPGLTFGGPSVPGFMTRGILNPQTYYYRRLMTDAVRALEAATAFAKTTTRIDASRLAVSGGSQGGGLALAVAGLAGLGLAPDVALALPDVPFLCSYRRATELTDAHPYGEISAFCKTHRGELETVFRTLGYFDGVNFAAHARASALFSVALMDEVCPPSTVYAAYNHYAGEKRLEVYPYNRHEGGEGFQVQAKLAFLRAHGE